MKFGFLGPPGTFTQEALLQVTDPESADLIYFPSVEEVLEAVADDQVDCGMVPIENSVEGTVNATQDALGFDHQDLRIEREVIMSIRLHLLARPGSLLEDVKTIFSMPHATAQCRKWLRANLPDAEIKASNSTAEAAGRVAYEDGKAAAIGPNLAAQLFGLEVLRRDVTDHPEAETRFVVVGKTGHEPTGRDKTSIIVFIAEDKPGALLDILQEFANRSVNLTKLESRPTKRVLGEYCFFIDMEGHETDDSVADAIRSLESHVAKIRPLGSYPRAVGARDAERLARRTRPAKVKATE